MDITIVPEEPGRFRAILNPSSEPHQSRRRLAGACLDRLRNPQDSLRTLFTQTLVTVRSDLKVIFLDDKYEMAFTYTQSQSGYIEAAHTVAAFFDRPFTGAESYPLYQALVGLFQVSEIQPATHLDRAILALYSLTSDDLAHLIQTAQKIHEAKVKR
jgi:hypothetical protein